MKRFHITLQKSKGSEFEKEKRMARINLYQRLKQAIKNHQVNVV